MYDVTPESWHLGDLYGGPSILCALIFNAIPKTDTVKAGDK